VTAMEIVVAQNGTSLWTRVVSSAPTLTACSAWTSDIDIEFLLLNCYLEPGSDKKADPLFVYKYFLFVKINLVTRGSSINLDQKGF